MNSHTDAGELLKLADEIERACKAPNYEARLGTIEGKMVVAVLRQAASQGSAGGDQSEVQSTPVSYRWRQPGNKHWIYDPTPAWIEDYKHEIELEALYLRAAQACKEPLRYCDYCSSWNSKPCGEGCVWTSSMPTVEEAKQKIITNSKRTPSVPSASRGTEA